MHVKETVAACLSEAEGQFLSGETLAQKLHVSRNAIWKAVKALQEEGFPIETRKKMGYRMVRHADLLSEETIAPYLQSRILGHPLRVVTSVDSTNRLLQQMLREGATHGTVVVANAQTAGRGRQGRTFYSPAGTGLYFSVLVSQSISLQDAPLVTACTAVATARAIDKLYQTHTQIKWVNDLYLDGKKCCGILTEGSVSLESGKMESVIIGIGINIRSTGTALPEQLHNKATSLEEAIPGCHVERARLLTAVLWELEQALHDLPSRRFLGEYRSRSCLIGKTVTFITNDGTEKKVAVLDIADDCGLMVRDTFGKIETLRSGEVHIGTLA